MKTAWRKSDPFSSVVDLITTEKDKKYEAVARIADAIIELTLKNGACMPSDLQAKGFLLKEVIAQWHFAHSLAAVELTCMNNKGTSLMQREARYA